MSELLRAKCKLYLELLNQYGGEFLPEPHDVVLMDALMRDKDIQNYLARKLKEI